MKNKKRSKKTDPEVKKALRRLKHINLWQPMSRLHPRFSVFQEALNLLVEKGEIAETDSAYFAFMYAEAGAIRRYAKR